MSVFTDKKTRTPSLEITGTTLLRVAAKNRDREDGLAKMARNTNIGLSQISDFIYAAGPLSDAAKQSLAAYLFNGFAEFDPTIDRLRSTNRTPAIPGGIPPEPCKRRPLSEVLGPPRPVPKTTALPHSARPHRPGWAE